MLNILKIGKKYFFNRKLGRTFVLMEKFVPPYEIEIPSNQGGPREGAGRYIVCDKKKQVQIGIKQSVIDKLGGKKQVQQILLDYIDKLIS